VFFESVADSWQDSRKSSDWPSATTIRPPRRCAARIFRLPRAGLALTGTPSSTIGLASDFQKALKAAALEANPGCWPARADTGQRYPV